MKKTILKCGINGMLWGSFAFLLFSILLSLRLNTGEFCFVLPALAADYGNGMTAGILQILAFLWLGGMCGAAYAIGNSTNLALWRQAAGYLCALTAGLGPVSFLGRWYEHLFVGIFSYLIFLGSISALLYLIGWINLRNDIVKIRNAIQADKEELQ